MTRSLLDRIVERANTSPIRKGVVSGLVGLLLGIFPYFFVVPLAWASPHGNCLNAPAVKDWIQRGNDVKNSYVSRHTAFESAIALCPSSPELYNAYSVLLLKYHDYSKALTWIDRGLHIAPGNTGLELNLGVALLSLGHPNDALAVLKQLPRNPKTEFYTGMAYRALGNHRAAREAFKEALQLGYDDPYVYYVLIEQDRLLGDKQGGLEHFQAFYKQFPRSPFLYMLLGDADLSLGKDEQAEGEYLNALEQNPTLPAVHFKLGYLNFQRARYSEAVPLFRKEIELSPDFAESYLYLGACLHRMGKDDEAIPQLKQAIARDPHLLLAYRELVAAEQGSGQMEAALRTLQSSVELFPDEQALHAQLAQLLKRIGHTVEARIEARLAEKLSKESIKQDEIDLHLIESSNKENPKANKTLVSGMQDVPNDLLVRKARIPLETGRGPRSLESRGSVQTHGRFGTFLEAARQCLERSNPRCAEEALNKVQDPLERKSADFFELRARSLALQHKFPEALKAISTAIQEDPTQPRYLLLQGKLYQKAGDQVSAIRSFLKCQQLDRGSPLPIYFIGMSFFALAYYSGDSADYDRATHHFKLVLELDPRFSNADFMLGVIEMARYTFEEATPYFKEAIKLDPKNPYYHLHYGVLLSRLGKNSEALREMGLAERLDPNYVLVHYGLGNLYTRLGRYEEARDQLEAAVRLDPHLARAFYILGNVYRRLGLTQKSREAYEKFQSMKKHEQVEDPVEATISASALQVNPVHQ